MIDVTAGKKMIYPDLCMSDENGVTSVQTGGLNRSSVLTFVSEQPIVQVRPSHRIYRKISMQELLDK